MNKFAPCKLKEDYAFISFFPGLVAKLASCKFPCFLVVCYWGAYWVFLPLLKEVQAPALFTADSACLSPAVVSPGTATLQVWCGNEGSAGSPCNGTWHNSLKYHKAVGDTFCGVTPPSRTGFKCLRRIKPDISASREEWLCIRSREQGMLWAWLMEVFAMQLIVIYRE